VPEHPPPDQPVKLELTSGVAVRVTTVLWLKEELQVLPQLMPAGLLVIMPLPAPDLVTFRAYVLSINSAVTALAAFMVT
jgi:hypothetical protein